MEVSYAVKGLIHCCKSAPFLLQITFVRANTDRKFHLLQRVFAKMLSGGTCGVLLNSQKSKSFDFCECTPKHLLYDNIRRKLAAVDHRLSPKCIRCLISIFTTIYIFMQLCATFLNFNVNANANLGKELMAKVV